MVEKVILKTIWKILIFSKPPFSLGEDTKGKKYKQSKRGNLMKFILYNILCSSPLVRIDLDYQLDSIRYHPGDTSLGLSGRAFLNRLNGREVPPSEQVVPVNEWLRYEEAPGKYTVAKMKKYLKNSRRVNFRK